MSCLIIAVNEYSCKLGRLVRQAISDKANTIAKFSQTFVDLKRAFDSAINLQIAFVSFRISEQVGQLGILPFKFLSAIVKMYSHFSSYGLQPSEIETPTCASPCSLGMSARYTTRHYPIHHGMGDHALRKKQYSLVAWSCWEWEKQHSNNNCQTFS